MYFDFALVTFSTLCKTEEDWCFIVVGKIAERVFPQQLIGTSMGNRKDTGPRKSL